MGPMDPKKTDAFCWKNGKRKISESIYMPRPQLLLPPLSLLLQLPLHEGFIVGAELHAGCKKVSKSSSSTTSANICNPCFSTYPARPIMNGKHHHHPTYMCALHNFLLKSSRDTFHLRQLAPRLVLQLLQRLQKRVPGDGANCSNVKFS